MNFIFRQLFETFKLIKLKFLISDSSRGQSPTVQMEEATQVLLKDNLSSPYAFKTLSIAHTATARAAYEADSMG